MFEKLAQAHSANIRFLQVILVDGKGDLENI